MAKEIVRCDFGLGELACGGVCLPRGNRCGTTRLRFVLVLVRARSTRLVCTGPAFFSGQDFQAGCPPAGFDRFREFFWHAFGADLVCQALMVVFDRNELDV